MEPARPIADPLSRRLVAVLVALGVGYWLGAEAAWGWFGASTLGLVFFPPAGLTLAAAVLLPRRRWPALAVVIFAVEVLTNLRHGAGLAPSMGYGLANVVEPLAGAVTIDALRRWRRLSGPELRNQMIRFVLGGVFAGPAIAALIGATVKSADAHDRWLVSAFQWTVGDGLGVLCVGGPLIALVAAPSARRPTLGSMAAAGAASAGMSMLAFWWWDHEPVAYLVLPVLLWAAVRTGAIGIGVPSAVTAVVANVATANGHGPFVDSDLSPQMQIALTQLFLAVTVLAAWLLAVEIDTRLVAERSRNQERLGRIRAEGHVAAARLTSRLDAANGPDHIVSILNAHLSATLDAAAVYLETAGEGGPGLSELEPTLADVPGAVLSTSVGRRSSGMQLHVVWDRPRELSALERAELQAATAVAGQALDRVRSYREAIDAQQVAERGALRLLALQRVTSHLLGARTMTDVANAIAEQAVPALDAMAALVLVRGGEEWLPMATEAAGDASAVRLRHGPGCPATRASVGDQPIQLDPGGAPSLVAEMAPLTALAAGIWVFQALELPSSVAGVLAVGFAPGRVVEADDLALISLLSEQSGQSVERVRQHELEHDAVERMQRMLLPPGVDSTESVSVQACYRPASSALELGGDWYDTIALDGHRMMLVVGDVVGSGLPAALAMGQLRSASRALASRLGPAEMLEVLDRCAAEVEGGFFTTAAAVLIDPLASRLQYSVAGHPPPMLRRGDHTMLLNEGRSFPLGVSRMPRPVAHCSFRADDLLVLYTDGLVERRGRSIDDGLEVLRDALVGLEWGPGAAEVLVDRCLGGAPQRDDIAILLNRLSPLHTVLRFELTNSPAALREIRAELRDLLVGLGTSAEETSDVLLAVGEALTNALRYAPGSVTMPISCDVVVRPDGQLVVTVRDHGKWLSRTEPRSEGGQGLSIITRLMDSVEIDRRPDGTVLRVRHHLASVSVQELAASPRR